MCKFQKSNKQQSLSGILPQTKPIVTCLSPVHARRAKLRCSRRGTRSISTSWFRLATLATAWSSIHFSPGCAIGMGVIRVTVRDSVESVAHRETCRDEVMWFLNFLVNLAANQLSEGAYCTQIPFSMALLFHQLKYLGLVLELAIPQKSKFCRNVMVKQCIWGFPLNFDKFWT